MNLTQMISLMEKLGFYAGPGYFTSEMDRTDNESLRFIKDKYSRFTKYEPFMKIESLATGDLLRSPLEPLKFSICLNDNPWCEVCVRHYSTLEEYLESEKPEAAVILRREYDPFEGLVIPEAGKKKLKKEIRHRNELRETAREIIRCVAGLTIGMEARI